MWRTGSCLILCAGLLIPGSAVAADSQGVEYFEKKVRPVLVEHCYKCHSLEHKKNRGGLYVDSRAALLKGGESGAALVPGKPEQSLLLKVLDHKGDLKMPPAGPLAANLVADLAAWVKMGAPAPDEKVEIAKERDWNEAKKFWSFQPLRAQSPPAVKQGGWVKNDLDRYILAGLEAKGLTPVGAADRRTLLRRVTFDLHGLPPTPEEVEAFVNDTAPRAFERVVDRLLASPRYGERWARHWLDVARYAEDQAHTFGVKPNSMAWRYRDWVIESLNADLPYDRFVKLQIAADLLEDARVEDRAALGFFGLGAVYYKNSNAAQVIAEELDDRVDTLTRGFLGLTVSCARCHDHKYDPIPTQDYYSLAGVFHSSRLADVPLAEKSVVSRFEQAQKAAAEAEKALKEFEKSEKVRIAETQAEQLAQYLVAGWKVRSKQGELSKVAKDEKLDRAMLDRMVKLLAPNSNMGKNLPTLVAWRRMTTKDAAEVSRLARELQEQAALARKKPSSGGGKTGKAMDQALYQVFFGENGVFAPAEKELSTRLTAEKKATHEQMQRQAAEKKQAVPPAPPMAHGLVEANAQDLKVYLRGNPANQGAVAPRRFLRILAGENPPAFRRGSGRLELAEAIASPENPLTARVMVNRVWMHHFGRGLVGTPSNFGALGEKPTHPELLDWLAGEFVRQGWSLKALHRVILLSSTYQLSSQPQESNQRIDPDNRYLWRMNRRRLDVESWRDALLSVSGQLDLSMGGPTVPLSVGNNQRRTVYAKVSRHDLDGLLRLFDFPDANITSEKRTETTVPQQQLFVLNSPFVLQRARELAARLRSRTTTEDSAIDLAYRLCFGRPPLEAERSLGRLYVTSSDASGTTKNQLTRWERYAQVLLGSNEFLYID